MPPSFVLVASACESPLPGASGSLNGSCTAGAVGAEGALAGGLPVGWAGQLEGGRPGGGGGRGGRARGGLPGGGGGPPVRPAPRLSGARIVERGRLARVRRGGADEDRGPLATSVDDVQRRVFLGGPA